MIAPRLTRAPAFIPCKTKNPASENPAKAAAGVAGSLVVLVLSAIFPPLAFVVLLLGLFFLCVAHRSAAVILGLALAVACVIGAMEIMTDPKMGDNAFVAILFLPWAGAGLWLAGRGLSKKRG